MTRSPRPSKVVILSDPVRRLLKMFALAVGAALIVLLAAASAQPAHAQTFATLYTFRGSTDGANPYGGLVRDSKGDLYGTARNGGDLSCDAPFGCGTVFKLHGRKETVIHKFTGGPGDGSHPAAGLMLDGVGNLYGTTEFGGRRGCIENCGTVFKLDRARKETVLYRFTGEADGGNPVAAPIQDSAGNLYGTTSSGTNGNGAGAVYKISRDRVTVLHTFDFQAFPYSGLVRDSEGNLYGTTWDGATSGSAMVYKVRGHKEVVLYNFGNSSEQDGVMPYGRLVLDDDGNLYGTTSAGGNYQCGDGCGTVFKVDNAGKGIYLHNFVDNGEDGTGPVAGLIRDENGNLFGTTSSGGTYGAGTVFELDKAGKETILHSFTGGTDGAYPFAELIRDAEGNLYGTTSGGGDPSCANQGPGCGVVFEIIR